MNLQRVKASPAGLLRARPLRARSDSRHGSVRPYRICLKATVGHEGTVRRAPTPRTARILVGPAGRTQYPWWPSPQGYALTEDRAVNHGSLRVSLALPLVRRCNSGMGESR